MKKFMSGSLALVALMAAVASASAADLAARPYAKAPVAVVDPTFNWSGFYLGAHAGYGWAREDHADLVPGGGWWTNGPAGQFAGVQGLRPSGAVYGGQAGYNWQAANWVFGIELAGNGTSIGGTDASLFFAASDKLSAKVEATFTASGRLGYAFNNWLPYVKGGYAGAQLNVTNSDMFGSRMEINKWRSGYVVGAGLEYGFASNWIVGVEYNYMDFGTQGFSGNRINAFGALAPTVERFDDKLTMSTVTARLSYKFGGAVVAKY